MADEDSDHAGHRLRQCEGNFPGACRRLLAAHGLPEGRIPAPDGRPDDGRGEAGAQAAPTAPFLTRRAQIETIRRVVAQFTQFRRPEPGSGG